MKLKNSIFVNTSKEEWSKIIPCFMFIFFLMFAYYIAKPVREGLTLEIGARSIPYLHLLVITSIFLMNFIYDNLVRNLERRKLVLILFSTFILIFLIFALVFNNTSELKSTDNLSIKNKIDPLNYLSPEIWIPEFSVSNKGEIKKETDVFSLVYWEPGIFFPETEINNEIKLKKEEMNKVYTPRGVLIILYFIWVSVFILFGVAILWSFINDIFTTDQGKKFFGIIGAGGPTGALLGSSLTSYFIKIIGIGNLLYLSSFFIFLALLAMIKADNIDKLQKKERIEKKEITEEIKDENSNKNGLSLILKHRYLLLIAATVMLYTFTQNVFHYKYAMIVQEQLSSTEARTALYANNYKYINILGTFIQFFVTGWVLVVLGVLAGLLVLPVCDGANYLMFMGGAELAYITWGIILASSVTYSLNNASREVLYTPTPKSFKYQAKGIIDTFFFRIGDALGSICIILISFFTLPTDLIFVFLGIVIVLRFVIAVILARMFKSENIINE